jgi:hypothetical protein
VKPKHIGSLILVGLTALPAAFSFIQKDPLAQPKVGCVEEVIPSLPGDFPDMTADVRAHWDKQIRDSQSVLNAQMPKFAGYGDSWANIEATKSAPGKANAIYQAADLYDLPPLVLTGALLQESSMAEFGISRDYGNWSCGLGQLNINEWCRWARAASPTIQSRTGWPIQEVADFIKSRPGQDLCGYGYLTPELAKPFHDIGIARLRAEEPGAREFMLLQDEILQPTRIEYPQVAAELRAIVKKAKLPTDSALEKLRFLIAKHFAENCSDYRNGIQAKASTLKTIFDTLPLEIQTAQHYKPGEHLERTCMRKTRSTAYPLSVGWLLADAIYNAGDQMVPAIYQYQAHSGKTWEQFRPSDLIAAIHFAIKKDKSGMSAIGKTEGMYHIQNVVNDVTWPSAR